MNVPLLDLRAQMKSIRKDVENEINDVLDSCQFIMGDKVTEFEQAVASYAGTEFGIGVSSGTDALLVVLMCLEIGPGDIVITTPYSFFATAGVVSRVGATPVFVDIDADTYNIDPAALSSWFEKNDALASKVRAIIPVHLYGQMADMTRILEIANSRNIPIIEDAAQSIGAKYEHGNSVLRAGSMGTFGCFSFFPSKNLGGVGDGGMVVTSDPDYAVKIRNLRNHGSFPKYYNELIGGNFRLDAIQAAVLGVKLKRLDEWHNARQTNAEHYDRGLSNIPEVSTPAIGQDRSYHIYNQYILRVEGRNDLREHLTSNSIGTEIYYPVPFHLQKCFAGLGYVEGEFPRSEEAANSTVAIPIYPELTTDMQDFVIKSIREFYV